MTQGAIETLVMFCKCVAIGGVIALIAWIVDKLEERWKNDRDKRNKR